MKTPDYRIEFPSFGELDVTIPEGFEDSSWHNDAMPSFSRKLPDGNYLRLSVDYKDKNMSDFSDVPEDRYFRFGLTLYDGEWDWIKDIDFSNDYSDILKSIEDFEAGKY